MTITQAIESGMTIEDVIADVLASDGVHFLVKDVLREALTKDYLDAYHDIQMVADILKVRVDNFHS